jgi:hypothetical protein
MYAKHQESAEGWRLSDKDLIEKRKKPEQN